MARRQDDSAPGIGAKPLWLFLSEPGLGPLLIKELKHRDVIRAKTRAQSWHLRNCDLLVFPDSQIVGDIRASRIALDVLACPIFGRHKITEAQLDRLAATARTDKIDGLTSSVAGSVFQRQDIMRWLEARLRDRGITLRQDASRPIRLFIIDESYYFGFTRFNYHEAPGRERDTDRHGSLPPTVAAAMCFAANPQSHEIVWDPVAGTGTLLREAAAMMSEPELIGSDIDSQAIEIAKAGLAAHARHRLYCADSTALDLERNDLTLTLANLPFGKQFKAGEGNAAFYEKILRRSLMHAAPNWRACLLTSDEPALDAAVIAIGTVSSQKVASVRIRGQLASIYLIRKRERFLEQR